MLEKGGTEKIREAVGRVDTDRDVERKEVRDREDRKRGRVTGREQGR